LFAVWPAAGLGGFLLRLSVEMPPRLVPCAGSPFRVTSVRDVILVVAATERELAGADGAERLACGIGPVEAAAATARALALGQHGALVNVGIAGAKTLDPPALVLGSEAVYCDIAADPGAVLPRVERVSPDATLLAAARRALPEAEVLPIATCAAIGGGSACEVEAMEGFAVLRAAELAGVPAVELRAVSNPVDERDRSRWRFDDALALLEAALARLLAELR
jgi:futalosine hydrolase